MVIAASSLYADVGNAIKKARKVRGLTQSDLASAVGLTRTSISNIETGRQKLLLHTFYEIARALDVDPVQLLPLRPTQEPTGLEGPGLKLPTHLASQERAFIEAAIMHKKRR